MKIEFSKQDENYMKLGSMIIFFSIVIVLIPLIYYGLESFISEKELQDLMEQYDIINELVSTFVLVVTCIMGGLLYVAIIIGCEIVKFAQRSHESESKK